MIPSLLRFLAAGCAALLLAGAVHGQTAIITKARAFVGPDAALDAVNSVHYKGTLVMVDPTDPTKKNQAAVDIIFQKPDRHRMTMTADKVVEITALDGYEAWQRVEYLDEPTKSRQGLANPDQIKRLRANTWENLAFFRGIETRGGRLEVLEPATMDGVTCNKIAFVYGPRIIFYRYFDQATGRLIATETETGTTIREEGEIMVNGIRFPKRIITTNKNTPGKAPTTTITFDEVTLNETFPDSVFAFPTFSRKK